MRWKCILGTVRHCLRSDSIGDAAPCVLPRKIVGLDTKPKNHSKHIFQCSGGAAFEGRIWMLPHT